MATKKTPQPTPTDIVKPVKTLLDNIKNAWGYFMTVVAIGTFVWTLGVKSERKNVDTASIKKTIESLKSDSQKIDTLIIMVSDIKETQQTLIQSQNALRDSYVKYLVNDPGLKKKDFLDYMQGLEFQIEMPVLPEVTKSTNDTVKYKPKITVRKSNSGSGGTLK
jgi:hypothetical protein